MVQHSDREYTDVRCIAVPRADCKYAKKEQPGLIGNCRQVVVDFGRLVEWVARLALLSRTFCEGVSWLQERLRKHVVSLSGDHARLLGKVKVSCFVQLPMRRAIIPGFCMRSWSGVMTMGNASSFLGRDGASGTTWP